MIIYQTECNHSEASFIIISLIFLRKSLQSSLIQAVVLGEFDLRFVTGTDDEDVRESGCEFLARCIPDVDDVKSSSVSDSVGDDPNSPDIVTTGDVGDVA